MYIVVRYIKEWWESDKHIAVMAMTEVLCLTWLSIQTIQMACLCLYVCRYYVLCQSG